MASMTTEQSASALETPSSWPRVLFLALANNVGCERIIGEMARHGAACAILSPPGYYCTRTQFATRRFVLPPQLGIWLASVCVHGALEAVVRRWRPDLVVPLDDVAASLLRGLAVGRASRRLRALLLHSLGDARGYAAIASRSRFLELADGVGVRIPASRQVTDAAATENAVDGWSWPVVVKLENTCGGTGVSLAYTAAELAHGVDAGLNRNSWIRRLKSTARNAVWRAAGHFPQAPRNVQVQQFVPGQPAMRTVAAWQGRELAGMSFLAECVHPALTGTSTVLKPLDHPEMAAASQRLVAALGVSGIVSFDFVIEQTGEGPASGAAYLIEMNPRPIGATHLGRLFGHDLCGALFSRLGWPVAQPMADAATQPVAIAVFPKELERSPRTDWLTRAGTLHDVPWQDPSLIDAYVRRLNRLHPDDAVLIQRQLARP